MLTLIINNLEIVGLAIALLVIVWLSNLVLSVFKNTKILLQKFEIARLKTGIIKLLSLILGTALLSITITCFPIFMQYAGIPLSEELVQIFTIGSIILIFSTSIIKYTKEALETLATILNSNK